MKALKIASIIIFSVVTFAYLAFLFIIPAFVKLDSFEYNLAGNDSKKPSIIVKLEDIRLRTTWDLGVGAKIDKVNAYYSSGEKFAQVDNLNVGISILHLLTRQIKLDRVLMDNVIVRLGVKKDGTFEIEKFIPTPDETPEAQNGLPYGLTFSTSMPRIYAKKYSATLKDISTKKLYAVKGENLRITDFDLNKKIKIETVGHVILNENRQFNYDVYVTSYILPDFSNAQSQDSSEPRFNIIDVLENMYKLNLTADLKTNIKLTGSMSEINADGNVDLTNLSVKVRNKQLPASNVNLVFKGDSIKINSELYTANDEKASIIGDFKYGKKHFIDMKVQSDRLELRNLFALVNAFLPIMGIDDINGVTANGILKANFNIKSDFKNINSSGHLKIKDANIYYNLFKVSLNNIQSDIDFSKNRIDIRQATANLNSAPISLTGVIDSNAFANIKLQANKIPVKGVLASLGQIQLLKENDIKSGLLTVNVLVKGKLDKVVPQIDVLVENLNLRNRPNKATVKLSTAVVKASTNKGKTTGNVTLSDMKVLLDKFPTVSLPSIKVTFDDKDILINNSYMYLSNSKIDIFGAIKDYSGKDVNVDITAKGLIKANDIKYMLDKNLRQGVTAVGKLPLIVKITGNDKVQDINMQLLANNTNYISVVNVSSLSGKTSLINFVAKMHNNSFKILDLSLNYLNKNNGLTEDFKANMVGANKVLGLKGNINNLNHKNPTIQGMNINIPNQVTISIPMLPNSAIQAKGDLNINGSLENPEIIGLVNIPYISIPTMKMVGKSITANITKNLIDINCSQLNVAGSSMNIIATINNNFKNGIYIKSMMLDASVLDLDSLLAMLVNIPQNANAPGVDMKIVLANGKGKITRFVTSGLEATNVFANFNIKNNLLTIDNITATAYAGKLAGKITYNLLYSNVKMNLQGRSMNASTVIYGATGMKNLLNGILDFDALDVSAVGTTDAQLMRSLKGKISFIVSDGQMGTLGKLENLLYAQNILANNLLKATLSTITAAVSIKKTGDFKYIKGKLDLVNGWVHIDSIQTSGPAMSMYITGRLNMMNNNANLIVLGRLSDEVVSILGPIGDFSVNKLLLSIPKIGEITNSMINQMTINPSGENLAMLPNLTPPQNETKAFKASINGSLESKNSVTYFKWLSTPKANATTSQTSTLPNTNTQTNAVPNVLNKIINTQPATPTTNAPKNPVSTGVADFINTLPDLMR